MFGYVRPLTGELLIKEYEVYKAIYCGLCRTGGKKVSRFTRAFLSYDFTALAALRLALSNEEAKTVKRRCPYGLKKRPALECDEVFTYTAAAFACLSYCKLCDDLKDEKGFSRFKKLLSKPIVKHMKKKADKLYPSLFKTVNAPLTELSRLEEGGERKSLDAYANGGAEAIAIIAAFGLDGVDAAIAHEAGYHIGRYIYIIDAIDDLEKDSKKKRFNPLTAYYGSAESAVANMHAVYETLEASAMRFSAAVGLAEGSVYASILQNIAVYGMENTAKTVYDKYAYKRKENKQL